MGGWEKYWGGWDVYCGWGWGKMITLLCDWLIAWGWFCDDEAITGIVWDFLIGNLDIAWKCWLFWWIYEDLGDTTTLLTLWLIGTWIGWGSCILLVGYIAWLSTRLPNLTFD